MSIQENKLQRFIKLGGYEIVKQVKRGRHKGKWRNLSEAARQTGLSRPTINKILEEHPQKPSKVQAKYVDRLEESQGYKRFKQMYEAKLDRNQFQQNIRFMREGFKMLGYNKDPVSWSEEDYKVLWHAKEFYSQECKGIKKATGVHFRRIMRATDRFDLLEKFKYKAPPEGKKKQWFLHDAEIKQLVTALKDDETLVLLFVGGAVGARHQALGDLLVKHIDFHDKTIQVHESKTGDYVTKYPPFCIFDMLLKFIDDRRLQPEDKVFPRGYSFHLKKLKQAGKQAKLKKTVTTHILKHTFVTQARRHRVSAEVIVEMTGTELRTLEKFYTGKDEAKIRFEMQGTEYTATPFHEWYASLSYFFRARYFQIRKKP